MKPFEGLSILLLEDEYLIAMDAEQILKDLGFEKVEVVNTIAGAAKCVDEGGANVAVLDVNINGEMSFAVAGKLRERGTPVVFATGYQLQHLTMAELEYGVCLSKPYTMDGLKDALLSALDKAHPPT